MMLQRVVQILLCCDVAGIINVVSREQLSALKRWRIARQELDTFVESVCVLSRYAVFARKSFGRI